MQRPHASSLAYGSAVVVLATAALLPLSGATSTLGIAVVCAAGLTLGLLVAVTMPVRTRSVKSSPAPVGTATAPATGPASNAPADSAGNEGIRVPAPRVGARTGTRIGS